MGNLGFIIPTKKLEDFNIDKIYSMLKEEFSDFNIEKGDSAIGIHKDTDLVCNLYFNQDCYLLDYDRDIESLEEITKESEESKYYKQTKERNDNLIKSLKELKDLNPDLNNVIQTTYGYGIGFDYKNDVDLFIKDYFYGYIFDEGIHPEFIPPDYVRKSKSKRFDGKTFVQKYIVYENSKNGYYVGYKDKLSNHYSNNIQVCKKYNNIGCAISRLGINLDDYSLDNILKRNVDNKRTNRFNTIENLFDSDVTKTFFIKGRIEKLDEFGNIEDASNEVLDYIKNKINIKTEKYNKQMKIIGNDKFEKIDVSSKEYLDDFLNNFN